MCQPLAQAFHLTCIVVMILLFLQGLIDMLIDKDKESCIYFWGSCGLIFVVFFLMSAFFPEDDGGGGEAEGGHCPAAPRPPASRPGPTFGGGDDCGHRNVPGPPLPPP